MFMVKVIKAKKEHLDILCTFANKLWQADETQHKSELGKILNSDFAVFFIVYEKNLPVGFAQCQLRNDYVEGSSSSPVGYLEGIFVEKEFRHKGYAHKLLEYCEFWAKENGAKEFASDCELENKDSIRFHTAENFKIANRIMCFIKKL